MTARKRLIFALIGAGSGAASAAATFVRLGDVAGPELFGRCLAMHIGGRCSGVDLSLYLFPGIVFGVAFAIRLASCDGVEPFRAAVLAIVSGFANAFAVLVCLALIDPVGNLIGSDSLIPVFSIAGATAGAAGSLVLSTAWMALAGRGSWTRSILAGAACGLLLPVAIMVSGGMFPFFIAWQAGYAAALASSVNRLAPVRR